MKQHWLKTTGLVFTSLGLAIVATAGVQAGARPLLGQVLGESTQLAQALPVGSSFLPSGAAGEAAVLSPLFQVNIPAVFTDAVSMLSLVVEEGSVFNGQARFVDEVILENGAQLLGNLDAEGIDIDVGTGEITASNLVYSVLAGAGITVSGDQDITITNADRGSTQKIFGKVKVGSDTAEAGSNTDTFEFSAGDGISLSLNTSDKKMTITGSNQSGWYKASSSNVVLLSSTDNVGIGTSAPTNKLEIDSGTDGASGVSFTRITSSTAAGIGGGKVLSVDSGGKIILVQDQTGDTATPSAEAVLPTATNGMTLYFNGLNWAASNNLFHDGGSVGISTATPVSRFHVYTNLATKIGQIIQGYTGQTANLTEWRDSSGSVLSYIDASGVFNGAANVSGSLNPGLTNGSVLFQGASGITQDNGNFFWDDTNNRLGIGTSSPGYPLTVVGQINSSTAYFKEQATNVGEIGTGSTAAFRFGAGWWGGSASYTPRFLNSAGTASAPNISFVNDSDLGMYRLDTDKLSLVSAGVDRVVIDASGNVGIGTSSPGYKLEVKVDSSSATNNALKISNSLGQPGIGTAIVFYGADTNNVNTYNTGRIYSTFDSINYASTRLTIQTPTGDGTWLNALTAKNGKISIGTTAEAGAPLEVGSTASVSQRWKYYSGGNYWLDMNQVVTSGNVRWSFDQTNNSVSYPNALVFNQGNIGVGIANPTALLHVNGGYGANDALTINQTLGGNILSASSSGATKLVLSNAGNLGIGTTTPGAKLEVSSGSILLGTNNTFLQGIASGDPRNLIGFDNSSPNNLVIGHTATSRYRSVVVNVGDDSSGAFVVNTGNGGGVLTEKFRISAAGNVGIGTTAPINRLHVKGTSLSGTALFGNDFSVNGSVGTRTLGTAGNVDYQPVLIGVGAPSSIVVDIKSLGSYGSYGFVGAATNALGTESAYGAYLSSSFNGSTFTSGTNTNYGSYNLGRVSSSAYTIGGTGNALVIGAQNVGELTNATISTSGTVSVYGSRNTATGVSGSTAVGGYFSASGGTNNYAAIFDTGNVGIGTTDPTTNLYVYEAAVADITLKSGLSGTALYFDSATGAGSGITFKAANVQKWAIFDRENFSGGPLTIQDNSNNIVTSWLDVGTSAVMGINTSAPTAPLHVVGAYGSNDALTINQTVSGNIMSASASGTTRMVLSYSGSLGIGTTSPGSILHLYSSGDPQLNVQTSSNGNPSLKLATDGWNWTLQNTRANQRFDIIGASATRLSINDNTGNIGIGTTGAGQLLELYANGGTPTLRFNANNAAWYGDISYRAGGSGATKYFSFDIASVSRMVVNADGNVGIGTTGPAAPLHVYNATDDNTALAVFQKTQSGGGNAGIRLHLGNWNDNNDTTRYSFRVTNGNTLASPTAETFRIGYDGTIASAMLTANTSTVDNGLIVNMSSTGTPAAGFGNAVSFLGSSDTTAGRSMGRLRTYWETATDASRKSKLTLSTYNGTTENDALTIDGSGNVGIGTTIPDARLNVVANSALPVYITGASAEAGIRLDTTAGSYWQMRSIGGGGGQSFDLRSANTGNVPFTVDSLGNAFLGGTASSTNPSLYVSVGGNVGLGTTSFGTSAAKALAIAGSTAPSTSITDGVQLFAVDVTGSHELQVRDEAGNVTTLSPHNFSQIETGKSEDLAWSFYSERGGLAINADMTKALRLVEKLSGEKLVYIKNLTNGADLSEFYAEEAEANLEVAQFVTQSELSPLVKWTNDTWTFISRVVFEKPAEFLAEVTFRGRVYFSDKDTAGQIIMKPGDTVAEVPFEHAFVVAPAVTLTTQNSYVRTTLAEVTPAGFKVTIESPQTTELKITWTALAVTGLRTTEGRSETQAAPAAAATASPNPTPAASSEPSPAATPATSPSPTGSAAPSPSPEVAGVSTEATPSPTPVASPTE